MYMVAVDVWDKMWTTGIAVRFNGIASYEIGLHKLYILYIEKNIFSVIYWQIKKL